MTRILIAAALLATTASGETVRYTAIFGGKNVGHVIVDRQGDNVTVDYDVKNNGRGPTMKEALTLGTDGLPTTWAITGATTFGSKVEEKFTRVDDKAMWTDSTGSGTAAVKGPGLYVAQSGSPWSDQIYATALLKAPGMSMAALPGGTLRLEKGETVAVAGAGGPLKVTRYTLSGIDLTPETMLLDDQGLLFASVSPNSIVVRAGYEGEEKRLRGLAADWTTARYTSMQKEVAHDYGAPVRIRNVRLFDPKTSSLTAPVSVLVNDKIIAAIEPIDSPATPDEVTIDGAGGTLIAGMYEMHGHIGQDIALLNLVAGITTVRDMGNDNAVLATLIKRIDAGEIGGPHIIRSGFIEGKSPFSANNGILVDSQQQAVDAVRWYGARGFWQIKIYNSMNPAWVPAMVAEAHKLGMRVAGHVPAFANADQMITAGYDEMTHINQFVLGWVIGPKEDTRTLFRLTALKRLPALDLNEPKVQHTLQLMVDGHKAIDPTLGIHENLLQNRDGKVPPGAVDYIDHMPIGTRRDAMKAWIDTSAPGDDKLYSQAFTKLVDTVRMLHDRGVFIVFGTDTGGSFTYHRELELYQKAGMTAPEILKRATYDSAKYVGEDQRMGSIDKGKLADFFLIPGDPTKDLKAIKTISMVVKDGVFYYPTEVYPKFGITPFTKAPTVQIPH
ncbi:MULTISPECIES: amidohydrolase family protein [Sphingosinicellaceae]|uniref:amidohydrolase family protein n=1 Tax=Sphingosinicellaceae TaxID=2820280 RepID=UPI001C1E0FDC|nr:MULTISPECIES: amidohydrolase family protein [Polymorphobacter]QYE33465.1 amidohydrolase family protein [Polymorphobacter sp. PAMC 29334]UAJ12829.1 amidohydrolase family protein [Polymorphobacter megasporae]